MEWKGGHNLLKAGISGSTLKLIAIGIMMIDHIAAVIVIRMLYSAAFYDHIQELYHVYTIMRIIGRLAFPIFCFLLVEGLLHTRSAAKYAIRMAIFALVSEIPFDLALYNRPFCFEHQNVFFTLLIGLLVLIGFRFIEGLKEDKKWLILIAVAGCIAAGIVLADEVKSIIMNQINSGNGLKGDTVYTVDIMGIVIAIAFSMVLLFLYLMIGRRSSFRKANSFFSEMAVLAAGMAVAGLLNTDYSDFGVLTIAVMYWLRRYKYLSVFGGCLTLTIMSESEIWAFFALIPVLLYNGKRGLKLKYVFYAFYPVHLLILYLICRFMGIA